MVDYIKSKSIKEYLKQEGVELTDLQKTVLILRTGYPMETIHASLGEIADKLRRRLGLKEKKSSNCAVNRSVCNESV